MKRTIYLLLLPLVWTACKKDSVRTFKGIVLHRVNNTPIAGAEIYLDFWRAPGSDRQASGYRTVTNSKGEYEVPVPGLDLDNIIYYLSSSYKPKLVQLVDTKKRSVTDPYADTLIMDDASYLHMTVKSANIPAPGNTQYFAWNFLRPGETVEVQFYAGKNWSFAGSVPGTEYAILDSFAYADHTRAVGQLYTTGVSADIILMKKEILLQPKDTTHVKIEY